MTDHSSPANAIAREIDDALDAFLYAKPEEKSKARAKVHAVLWENKAGIVAGLRIPAQQMPSAEQRLDEDMALLNNTRAEAIEECAKVADGLAEWFGEHQAFLAEDAVDDCARRIRALAFTSPESQRHDTDPISLKRQAAEELNRPIQPQCAPDREALVRAIQLSYARKDLEPTSATTLALYREDAENAADAVLALTRPEHGDEQ